MAQGDVDLDILAVQGFQFLPSPTRHAEERLSIIVLLYIHIGKFKGRKTSS